MNANEAMRVWALRELEIRRKEMEISDEDIVLVEERDFSDGYCDTCYYEETSLAITVNGETIVKVYESFPELMEELIKIVQEDGNA